MTDTVIIKLTQGKVAVVDTADYPLVRDYKWSARLSEGENTWYALSNTPYVNSRRRTLLMHRVILGLEGRKPYVDHRDGDGLNNRRSNLRTASQSQNMANARLSRVNTSGFKGVRFKQGAWRARIIVNYKHTEWGTFKTPEDAARAYDAKAKELFGDFAKLNFPETETT